MTLISMVQGLVTRGARIVVVRGFAASIQGSAIITEDLDVCYAAADLVPAFGIVIPTLRIGAVIQAKRFANRPKDHRALPELEAVAAARGEWPPSAG